MSALHANPNAEAKRLLVEGFSSLRAFCGLLDIITKDAGGGSGGKTKLRLTPIQKRYCQNMTARDIVLKARQVKISTVALARDLQYWFTHPGCRVVVMCQSSSNKDDSSPARDFAARIEIMLRGLGALGLRDARPISEGGMVRHAGLSWVLEGLDSRLSIVEAGASAASADKKGRSGTVHRLHVTEQAFFEYAQESLNAIEECVPKVGSGSEIIKESTPKGVGGKFYDDVQAAKAPAGCPLLTPGASGYTLHFYPWFQEPEYAVPLEHGEEIEPESDREQFLAKQGCTPEQIKWFRQKVASKGSQDLVDQEYPSDPETCFLLSGRPFFSMERIEKMRLDAEHKPPLRRIPVQFDGARGELRVWHLPEKGSRYVLSLDPSEGTGGDPLGGKVLERGTGKVCATLHGQFKPHAAARIAALRPAEMKPGMSPPAIGLGYWFNEAMVAVERNNHGHAVLQALHREHHYRNIFVHHDKKPGWLNTEVTRTKALNDLDNALRDGSLTDLDLATLGEMRTFITNDRGRVEAARGSHDDLVLALAIGRDVLTIPEPPRGTGVTHDLGIL
jgi:hypothetical protein